MTDNALTLREFQPGDEEAFRRLNEEWIVRYFKLEPKDTYSLHVPRETILDKGGHIYFTLRNGKIIGCCALLAMGENEYEVAKMAVAASAQGSGAGRFQLAAVIEAARNLGAKRLYLETNHVLTPAIHLYESLGFRHIPPDRVTPSPYQRADVYMEMYL